MRIVLRIIALSLAVLTTMMFASCGKQGGGSANSSKQSTSKQSGSKAASSKAASESASQADSSSETASKQVISVEPFTMPADGFGLQQVTYYNNRSAVQTARREGNYVYISGGNALKKYDYSDPLSPKLVKQVELFSASKKMNLNSMVINGDYIYMGCRRYQANIPNPYTTNGLIIIVKKSDLSIVTSAKMTFPNGSTTEYGAEAGEGHVNWDANDVKVGTDIEEQQGTFKYSKGVCEVNFKVSHFLMYKNMLIVNMQMRGWCIFTIDEKDPTHLTLTDTYFWGEVPIVEHQGGDVYEHNGKIYYVAAGFGDGISFYDITDPTNIKQELRYNFWNASHFDSEAKGKVHTFSLTVDYPYVYATLGPAASVVYNKPSADYDNRIMGVLTIDIANLKKPKYNISKIADADRCEFNETGDPQPTRIVRFGDYLLLNSSDKGVAVFKINDKANPTYMKTVKINDGKDIAALEKFSDDEVFIGEHSSPNKYYIYKVRTK